MSSVEKEMGHYSATEGWLHIEVKRRVKASGYQKGLVLRSITLGKTKSEGRKMQIVIRHSPLEYCVILMK